MIQNFSLIKMFAILFYYFLTVFAGPFDELDPKEIARDPEKFWGYDTAYSGIVTFAHLEHKRCLVDQKADFDIAILGFPFDTAVSYRTGARFGPRSIRANSMRQAAGKAFNVPLGMDPYTSWAKIIDCGDIPLSAYDNAVAVKQMNAAYGSLLDRKPKNYDSKVNKFPRIISLGGDHSIAYPILKQLKKKYGSISVIHFDSHIDTWSPVRYSGPWSSPTSDFTHGSMLHLAAMEGAISNSTSVHAGLRTRLSGLEDYEHDEILGFKFVEAREIDEIGVKGVIERIRNTVGNSPCYLSIDIDVVDPAMAPGTGTPEIGGWTTREMKSIIHGLKNLNLVGADIVEVSPPFDNEAETTSLAAAEFIYEILGIMVADDRFSSFKNYEAPKFFIPSDREGIEERKVKGSDEL